MRQFIFLVLAMWAFARQPYAKEFPMKQIRTYMPYSYPIDPVRLVSIADMDLSYALGSTLVQWDKDKQISGAVAESWDTRSANIYRFKIRKNLKWSNGAPVTASDIKASFERAFKAHPEDLRSLINLTKKIVDVDEQTIDFELSTEAKHSGFLGKLTEPNYGILKIKKDGSLDLSVTSGAFYLEVDSSTALTLKKNKNWFFTSEKMAEEILIRKPPASLDWQKVLLADAWPNFIETSSLTSAETMNAYRAGQYKVWTRPLDKLFMMQLSKTFASADGPALLRYLYQFADRAELTKGLSGFTNSMQVFPDGYQLHDKEMPQSEETAKFPETFKNKSLRILISPSRVTPVLQENIKKMLVKAGVNPAFEALPLDQIGDREKKGDFDVYIGSMGLADPDPEGIMSYYFEGATPVVLSGKESFVAKLDTARNEKDERARLKLMRKLMTEATLKGHILPLFHMSTVGIGREELDFSSVPSSDESVTLSKIRFRSGSN